MAFGMYHVRSDSLCVRIDGIGAAVCCVPRYFLLRSFYFFVCFVCSFVVGSGGGGGCVRSRGEVGGGSGGGVCVS